MIEADLFLISSEHLLMSSLAFGYVPPDDYAETMTNFFLVPRRQQKL